MQGCSAQRLTRDVETATLSWCTRDPKQQPMGRVARYKDSRETRDCLIARELANRKRDSCVKDIIVTMDQYCSLHETLSIGCDCVTILDCFVRLRVCVMCGDCQVDEFWLCSLF